MAIGFIMLNEAAKSTTESQKGRNKGVLMDFLGIDWLIDWFHNPIYIDSFFSGLFIAYTVE